MKKTNPTLFTQFILFDYWQTINSTVKYGIKYESKIVSGSWEFVFSKPRQDGKYPVVKHAKFTGLK